MVTPLFGEKQHSGARGHAVALGHVPSRVLGQCQGGGARAVPSPQSGPPSRGCPEHLQCHHFIRNGQTQGRKTASQKSCPLLGIKSDFCSARNKGVARHWLDERAARHDGWAPPPESVDSKRVFENVVSSSFFSRRSGKNGSVESSYKILQEGYTQSLDKSKCVYNCLQSL